MIGGAHPIQFGGVRGSGKGIIKRRNPTGSLGHTRDPIEGVHVGVFAKLFFDARGAIWREAIVRLLPHGPITLYRLNITGKGFGSKFNELQRTSPILYGGHGGSGQGIGYVFLGLNTGRRFATRGRNHNCWGRVHRSDRPKNGNGYAPNGLA